MTDYYPPGDNSKAPWYEPLSGWIYSHIGKCETCEESPIELNNGELCEKCWEKNENED